MTTITASQLYNFDLAEDGSTIRMTVLDQDGAPAHIVLPAACLHQLLMTVPRMIDMALQAKFQDASLRLVFALSDWRIEQAQPSKTIILTLRTEDGFTVSFGLPGNLADAVGQGLVSCAAYADRTPLGSEQPAAQDDPFADAIPATRH